MSKVNTKALAKQLVSAAKWFPAPVRTEWGAGMMVADIELSKDETLTIYAHKKAIPKEGTCS
jgi:hypothetical protein